MELGVHRGTDLPGSARRPIATSFAGTCQQVQVKGQLLEHAVSWSASDGWLNEGL
jgi:hypothetical protein